MYRGFALTSPIYLDHFMRRSKARNSETIELTDHWVACLEQLKNRLATPPVLRLPDFSRLFGIRMNVSNFAIGGVSFQEERGMECLIAYTGRKMKPADLNYPVDDQDLPGIMLALKVCRVYLIDRPFDVETDNKNIEIILTQKTTNRRVVRWFYELAEFHPKFKWIPENTNDVADALSRNPVFERAQGSASYSVKPAQSGCKPGSGCGHEKSYGITRRNDTKAIQLRPTYPEARKAAFGGYGSSQVRTDQ